MSHKRNNDTLLEQNIFQCIFSYNREMFHMQFIPGGICTWNLFICYNMDNLHEPSVLIGLLKGLKQPDCHEIINCLQSVYASFVVM